VVTKPQQQKVQLYIIPHIHRLFTNGELGGIRRYQAYRFRKIKLITVFVSSWPHSTRTFGSKCWKQKLNF